MRKWILIQIVIVLFRVIPASCQDDTIDSTLTATDTLFKDFGLFSNEDILKVTMRFNITTYMRKKPKDEYLPAVLTYHMSENDSINKDILLKTRGNMRYGYCDFPPIQLNIKEEGSNNNDSIEIKKIKMVTHCKTGNEKYLIKEYLDL